jgi:hypothetical protein
VSSDRAGAQLDDARSCSSTGPRRVGPAGGQRAGRRLRATPDLDAVGVVVPVVDAVKTVDVPGWSSPGVDRSRSSSRSDGPSQCVDVPWTRSPVSLVDRRIGVGVTTFATVWTGPGRHDHTRPSAAIRPGGPDRWRPDQTPDPPSANHEPVLAAAGRMPRTRSHRLLPGERRRGGRSTSQGGLRGVSDPIGLPRTRTHPQGEGRHLGRGHRARATSHHPPASPHRLSRA